MSPTSRPGESIGTWREVQTIIPPISCPGSGATSGESGRLAELLTGVTGGDDDGGEDRRWGELGFSIAKSESSTLNVG
jgi:hypothetical protein